MRKATMFGLAVVTGAVLSVMSGSALAGEQVRNTGNFSSIRTQGALIVEVEVGPVASIKVKGDDKYISKVVTDVVGDELLISYKEKGNIRISDDLKVVITTPNLTKFKMEGAGLTTVKKISGDRFDLNYEGVGMLVMSGKVNSFKVRAQGVGHVDAKDLIAESVDANVEGIGSVKVYATEKLKANVQGIGSLTYYGNPKNISKTVDGIGGVSAGK